jgi:hypothetical protein
MAEFFLALFIFLGVMAVTALIFGGWVIVNVFRGVGTLLGFRPPPRLPQHMAGMPPRTPFQSNVPAGYVQCQVSGCRHVNPATAKFCRHCGHAFPPPQPAVARRVAAF